MSSVYCLSVIRKYLSCLLTVSGIKLSLFLVNTYTLTHILIYLPPHLHEAAFSSLAGSMTAAGLAVNWLIFHERQTNAAAHILTLTLKALCTNIVNA